MQFALLMLVLVMADPTPTIDGLIEQIQKSRQQRAELLKAEEATVGELKKLLADLQKKLADLNLDGPKVPDPVKPDPLDPLTVALKAAYEADPGTNKAEALKELVELYQQAAILAANPQVKTLEELLTRLRQAMTVLPLLNGSALMPLRKLIAAEVQQALGAEPDTALAPATRDKAVQTFQKIHLALKGIN